MNEAPPIEKMILNKGADPGGAIEGAISGPDDTVDFPGWAVDPVARTPASIVFAYRGDRVVGAATLKIRRPDLSAGLQSDLIAFRLSIPRTEIQGEPLRFFATNPNGSSRELTVIPEARATVELLKAR